MVESVAEYANASQLGARGAKVRTAELAEPAILGSPGRFHLYEHCTGMRRVSPVLGTWKYFKYIVLIALLQVSFSYFT